MEVFLDILMIVVGFVLLMKGADFFVDGASALAARLGIPSLIIGLTIVAIGTSAPEAAVSIDAALKQSTGIAIGNIYGSNILNILVILGVTACITTLKVGKTTIRYEIPFMILATVVLAGLGTVAGKIGWISGIILWALFLIYLGYLFYQAKHMGTSGEEVKSRKGYQIVLFLVLGGAAIILGSDLAVDGATGVARVLGVSDRIIGLTIIAFGTSLPELITSIAAARKGQADIAIGNIVGSNLFNILFVLGTASLISDISYSSAFFVDSIVATAVAVLLLVCVCRKGELNRKAGVLMLLCYAAYFVYMLV